MTTDPYSFALEVDGWTGPQHPTDTSDLPPECPACGEPIDYCQGHGEIGDPLGADILRRHDGDDHSHCLTICD